MYLITQLARVKRPSQSWFVSPSGDAGNAGTIDSPWDIVTGFSSTQVKPGDTVYFRGGVYQYLPREANDSTYQNRWLISLQGSRQFPIWVKPYNNEHVEIDGGIGAQNAPNDPRHVYIMDFDFYISENIGDPRYTPTTGSDGYKTLGRYWGGIDMARGTNLKIINCLIHDCAQGIGWWSDIKGGELYGCIIYNNGWTSDDRNHGHGIYTQNESAAALHGQWKYYRNNILIDNWSLTIQAYGSGASRLNFAHFEKNIWVIYEESDSGNVLVGLSSPTMHYINFIDNFGGDHGPDKWLGRPSIGYTAQIPGRYLNVKDNVNHSIFEVLSNSYNVDCQNNWVWRAGTPSFPYNFHTLPAILSCSGNPAVSIETPTAIPSSPMVKLNINQYDTSKAYIGIIAFSGEVSVDVDVSSFLTNGDTYHILSPTGMWSAPLSSGVYTSGTIPFPMEGISSGDTIYGLKATELTAFVLKKV